MVSDPGYKPSQSTTNTGVMSGTGVWYGAHPPTHKTSRGRYLPQRRVGRVSPVLWSLGPDDPPQNMLDMVAHNVDPPPEYSDADAVEAAAAQNAAYDTAIQQCMEVLQRQAGSDRDFDPQREPGPT
jgi:hypothetical protein